MSTNVYYAADHQKLGKDVWRTYKTDYPLGLCDCGSCVADWVNNGRPGRLAKKRLHTDYEFRLHIGGGEHLVTAGCREFTIKEYRQHVRENYPRTDKALATLAILKAFEDRLKAHNAKLKAKAAKAKKATKKGAR